MTEILSSLTAPGALAAFFEVIMIDLVLAGDNAVVIGLAAVGLPAHQRRKAIAAGIIAATLLRIGFAIFTVQLLQVIGLLFAGGILLLWVCWKMWREIRHNRDRGPISASEVPRKTLLQATTQIVVADISMSLDNVLAVAGAAREHPVALVFGLGLSIVLMGVGASLIAGLLHKQRWIGYVGLAIILYVAVEMIWRGSEELLPYLTRPEIRIPPAPHSARAKAPART